MKESIHTILSGSGSFLQLMIRSPEQKPKGVVQINTGTCIPQRIYWKFAEYLAKEGYISITYECTDASNYSSEVSHTAWIKDMESVFDYVLETYPALKKIMVGHSSGGQLVGYLNNCSKIDQLYLPACSNGYIGYLSLPMQWIMRVFWKLVLPLSLWKYGYMNNRLFFTNGGFPKNIILELRSWCFQPDFFIPFFRSKNIPPHYHEITCAVKAYHLSDDVIANKRSCEYILHLYTRAQGSLETLHAKDYGMRKFGHRGFFHPDAEKLVWPKFIKDVEK